MTTLWLNDCMNDWVTRISWISVDICWSGLSSRPLCRYVALPTTDDHIWTLSMNAECPAKTPLVLLHGMGSGIALWVLNLDYLARDRPLYAIDVLGFGRSSRVSFSSDPVEAETQFVQSIEDWRKAVGIDRMILLGHSLGGYIATSYALSHAEHVKHLILVDPWGFPECPTQVEQRRDIPRWVRMIRCVISPFNPLSGLRLAGPWGESSQLLTNCCIINFIFSQMSSVQRWKILWYFQKYQKSIFFFHIFNTYQAFADTWFWLYLLLCCYCQY